MAAIETRTEALEKRYGAENVIVVFDIDGERRIADLPGYGFAKVPEKLKRHWRHVMQRYFDSRRSLRGVVLVMDIRHPMRPFDEQMLAWCSACGVPCHVLLTKADKLKRGPARSTLLKLRRGLPEIASAQVFSARTRDGIETLIERLNEWYDLATKG